MTVIAALSLNGVPALLVDTLISGVERHDLVLPTSGRVSNLPNAGQGKPTTLARKVVQVGSNLLVAFAGDLLPIETALRSLRRASADAGGVMTPELWQQFIEQKAPMLRRVAIVGWTWSVEDAGEMPTPVLHRAKRGELRHFGLAYAAGSGIQELQDACEWLPADDAAQDGHHAALRSAAALVGVLLREEHASGTSISRGRAGGFYEIALWDGRQFNFLNDVTYVIWDSEVGPDGTGTLRSPMLILRQFYDNGHRQLLVESWRVSGEEGPFMDGKQRVFEMTHVIPLFGVPGDGSVLSTDSPDYQSAVTVNCAGVFSTVDRSGLGVALTVEDEPSFRFVAGTGPVQTCTFPNAPRVRLWERVQRLAPQPVAVSEAGGKNPQI